MNKSQEIVELPAPTVWPLVFALAVSLIFAGLLSSAYVSMAGGLLLLIAAVGWWREVLPHEKHESVAVEPADISTPRVVIPVEFLQAGIEKHRVRVGVKIQPFSAGFKGGVVGGVGMAGVAIIFGLISQGSIWYPINLLAAAAVPSLATASVEQLREFSALGLILGAIIHGLGSILVGVLYAVMLPMFPRKAFWWAGVSAPILWSGVIATMLDFVNPALAARVDWRWFVASQLAFGLTGGFVIARTEGIDSRRDWPLELRAGLEAPGTLPPLE
ncbi:MAG TPA: hypothetical protein VG273_07555 [Bryobacteraceae bacterium]|jgi:hypothetical protein|nr:hypothetical protein [Bryobacteraceae bacterium]